MCEDDDMPGHLEGRRRSHRLWWLAADILVVLLAVLVLAWPAGGRPAVSATSLPADVTAGDFLPLFRAPFQWETTPPTPTLPPTSTPLPPAPTPRPTDTPLLPPPTATFTPAPPPTHTPTPPAVETPTYTPAPTVTMTCTPTSSPTPSQTPTTAVPPTSTPSPTAGATWTPAPPTPTKTPTLAAAAAPAQAEMTPVSTPAFAPRQPHLEGYILLAVTALGAGVAAALWLLSRRRH